MSRKKQNNQHHRNKYLKMNHKKSKNLSIRLKSNKIKHPKKLPKNTITKILNLNQLNKSQSPRGTFRNTDSLSLNFPSRH